MMINEILKLPLRIGFSHNNNVNPHYLIDSGENKLLAVDTNFIKRVDLSKIALALNMFDLVVDELESATNTLALAFTESKANTISNPIERANYLKEVRVIKDNQAFLERLRKDAS